MADLGAARPPVRPVEVRRDARRPDRRRRRHQPLDHLPESRADVHRLRAEADAVVVGSGTARTDDPQLGVRGVEGAVQPLRVVVDTGATAVRPGARVLDGTAPTLVAVADDADTGHLPEGTVLRLPRAATGPGLDIHALLAALHTRGVRSVLLEGGPTLAGAFVAAGTVDKVVGYLAPVLLGAGPRLSPTQESPPSPRRCASK